MDEISVDSARTVTLSAKSLATQISLFNRYLDRFDDQQVKDMLGTLPEPISDIRHGFATPRIESSEVNLQFVAWLKSRGLLRLLEKRRILRRRHLYEHVQEVNGVRLSRQR